MRKLRKSLFISITAFAGFAANGYASDKSIDASKCPETKMQVSQEIGNVFSSSGGHIQ